MYNTLHFCQYLEKKKQKLLKSAINLQSVSILSVYFPFAFFSNKIFWNYRGRIEFCKKKLWKILINFLEQLNQVKKIKQIKFRYFFEKSSNFFFNFSGIFFRSFFSIQVIKLVQIFVVLIVRSSVIIAFFSMEIN